MEVTICDFQCYQGNYPNDINKETAQQLKLINQSLAELQIKRRRDERPRNPVGFIQHQEIKQQENSWKDAELFQKAEGVLSNFSRAFKSPRHSKNRSWRFSKTPWRICKKVKENLPVCFDGLSKHISIYMWICVSTLHPLHLRYTFMQKWAIPSIKWKGEGLIKKTCHSEQ